MQNKMNISFYYLVVVIVLFAINSSVNNVVASAVDQTGIIDVADYSNTDAIATDYDYHYDSRIIMTPIDLNKNVLLNGVIQGITEINIDLPSCNDSAIDAGSTVPDTMFTIYPSNEGDGVTVETSPANLFIVKIDEYDGGLVFEWNQPVSSTATSGGVRIGIPSDQLSRVDVVNGHTVQIEDGFTSIQHLHVDTNSILRASIMNSSPCDYNSLTECSLTQLRLANHGGQMLIETNVPVSSFRGTGGGKSWVETPISHNVFYVTGEGSELSIKGDVDGSKSLNGGLVKFGAQLTVTGSVTGNIECFDNSTVNTTSCYNVRTYDNSTCNAGPQNVNFDVRNVSQTSKLLHGTCIAAPSSSFARGSYSIALFVLMAAVTVLAC